MIKNIILYPYTKKCLVVLALFLVGIIVLTVRNPDPLVNPALFAEDGKWTGLGLSYGWLHTMFHTRTDYFTVGNILLLFLATKLSCLLSGNPLSLLPQSVAIVSYAFFSGVATTAFLITKESLPLISRIILFILLLLLPL